jgi:hypothetical protein
MKKVLLDLKNILKENSDKTDSFKRNLLKEYLQVFALDFIYSDEKYGQLIFYGGSVLAHCHGLPRLSEDLDFVDLSGKIEMENLAKDFEEYFKKELGLSLKTKTQKFRIYLKFPILARLGLAGGSKSDWLHLKIEVFDGSDFCKKHKTEIRPFFKFNHSVLIRTFDLPTLMATKIRAILNRKWEKTDKQGNVLISVKGRDYFDLMWYLQKGISPNLACVKEVKDAEELKKKLLSIVENIDTRSIVLDLENFISDRNFAKNLGKNIKDILKNEIGNLK